jgi:hypothetical protein
MIYRRFIFSPLVWGAVIGVWICLAGRTYAQEASASKPFNFEEASRDVPKPRESGPW